MKNVDSGSRGLSAKDLLASARHDRPSAEQRSRIWEQVALAPHLSLVAPVAAEAARTSIAPAKALAGGLSAGKMLLFGVLAGTALTVSGGLWLGRSSPATAKLPAPGVGRVVAAPTVANAGAAGAAKDVTTDQRADRAGETTEIYGPALPLDRTAARVPPRSAARGAVAGRAKPSAQAEEAAPQDELMHEAALVSHARTAIVQGHAAAALDMLDLAAQDTSHGLEPEELSLRSRALRLLGRESEAVVVEETLKARYPGSFLAR